MKNVLTFPNCCCFSISNNDDRPKDWLSQAYFSVEAVEVAGLQGMCDA